MTARVEIDSNVTGLRFAEQASGLNTEPAGPWFPLEPNSYSDFGGQITTTKRDPINADRQNKFGTVTDLDASGGFNHDLTNDPRIQKLLQGFFFANLRKKAEFGNVAEGGTGVITSVTGANQYAAASGLTAFAVGRLVLASNLGTLANNGLKRVTVSAAALLTVAETLVAEAGPPAAAQLVEVGVQGASADINVDNSGSFPALTSTALNFTLLGLIPGEWVFIGGDTAPLRFVNAANNGFKRVRSITATRLEFDKSGLAMITETGTGLTIQAFYGRVLKNELAASQVRRLYNLERVLGAPDDASPSQIQSEYLEDAVANEFSLNFSGNDKAMFDMSFVACDYRTRTGVVGVKTGTRPALNAFGTYNTVSSFSRLKLSLVTASAFQANLFGFASELTVTLSNGANPRKALGVLGAFEVTVGNFDVSGDMTAYFADVAAIDAIRNNAQVTIDAIMVNERKAIALDIPLLNLGEGRLNVEKDEPITLPLSLMAADGASITLSTALNHTLLMSFFDYVPVLAVPT